MATRINTNLSSLVALNQLRSGQQARFNTFQRLASGSRINSAADDAAGLAISSRFESQIRGLNQAVRNANDGISYTQVAEGALSSTTDNLQRIRELSIQAANGTLTDSDRQSIQAEIDQLSGEITRIGETTTFNGQPVLDGSRGNQQIQVGAGPRETIALPNIDGRSDTLGRAAETTSQGNIDANGIEAGELSINGVDIRATQASDDTLSTADQQGSARAVAAAINDSADQTGVTATVNETEVSGGNIGGGTLDSTNTLTINGETITGVNVQGGDAGEELIGAINAASEDTGVTASRNANGGIDLTAADGRNIDVQTTGTASAITGLNNGTTTGSVTLTSEQQFTVGGTAPGDTGFTAGVEGIRPDNAVTSIDVTTQQGANDALRVVDRALEQVSSTRSELGALQNRFNSTINNLSNVVENASAANSRIADADFAAETSRSVREAILEQAQISVLAQANTSNRSAFALLGN